MEIRYLEQEEKEMSRELWKVCFPEDSARFLNYYYGERCRDNEILALEEQEDEEDKENEGGSRIISMLHRNPYRVQVGNGAVTESTVYTLDYIVAVATAPDRRHRGCMRRLLSRMMADQYQEQMPFTFLMPADPEIYRPFGFEYVYRQPHWRLTEEGQRRLRRVPVSGEAEAAEAGIWLNAWLERKYRIFSRRDREYMTRLWKEIQSEYGCWELLFDGSRMAGMECFWGKETKERRFLYAEEEFLEEEKPASPAIMARIIHLKEFVKGICLEGKDGLEGKSGSEENSGLEKGPGPERKPELEIILGIRDRELEENNGLFSWKFFSEGGSVIEKLEDRVPEDIWSIPIESLTQWLLGYRTADDIIEEMKKEPETEPETEAGTETEGPLVWKTISGKQEKPEPVCGDALLKIVGKIRTMGGIFLDEVV